jgi:hypothetical protein
MNYQAPARKTPINAETGPKDQLAESSANSRAMDDRATNAARDTARKGSGGVAINPDRSRNCILPHQSRVRLCCRAGR